MPADAPVHRALAIEAFEAGFAAGADPRSAKRRTIVAPATHAHWRAGYDAAREARREAVERYRGSL